MTSYRDKYIAEHTLLFDHENSACGECPLTECGYYYNTCPQEQKNGKTIVTNAFSGNMINIDEYSTVVSKISEEEFLELIRDADSNISHPGIAHRYHLPLNPGKIRLVPGDNIIVVYIHGGKLPSNGRLPWNVQLTFEHIQVIQKVIL